MQDSCLISREIQSIREKDLKAKLFGTAKNGNQPMISMPKSYTQEMDQKKQKWHAAQTQPSEYLYKPPAETASLVGMQSKEIKKMTKNQEEKMQTFIDEMRQNYLSSQNANVVPQSLMYRQTQMMERQLGVLESNQKQIGEIIGNLVNQGASGPQSSSNIKQNVFNDNRRMMLEMMAPINTQLNEMKLLYENTKNCSKDVGDKIDELKKIIQLQQNSLAGGNQSVGQNPFLDGGFNQTLMENYLDPKVIKKGIDQIKESMLDVQKEAYQIENEMDKRFKDLLFKQEQKLRNFPQSLTQEMENIQTVQKQVSKNIDEAPSFNKTRDLIIQRLGGPFDYTQFSEDLRQLKVSRDQVKRQFKNQQLWAPELSKEDFGGKKVFYDFGVRPMIDTFEQKLQKTFEQTQISLTKPLHLKELKTSPPQFMISDDFSTLKKEQPQQRQEVQQQVAPQIQAPVRMKSQQKIIEEEITESPQIPKSFDLLTLKKQVIEEIRQELEREAKEKFERDERAHQALIAQRLRQQQKEEIQNGGRIPYPESKIDTQIQGKKVNDKVDDDDQSSILQKLREAQLLSVQNVNDFMRQSVKSLAASENQSLNESNLADAIADYFVKKQPQQDNKDQNNTDYKKVGEEIIIQKLNKIFDEFKNDNREFEQSYQLSENKKNRNLIESSQFMNDQSIDDENRRNNQKINQQKKVQIVENDIQAGRQSQQFQNQPFVIPVIINQQNQNAQQNGAFPQNDSLMGLSADELRNMIQQAVSTQLQIQSLKNKDSFARQSMATSKSYDSNRTTQTLNEEEIKIRVEQQLLNKQIPVNIQPQLIQNLGLQNRQLNNQQIGYINPFSNILGNTMSLQSGNPFNIKPPFIGDLSAFDIQKDFDDSSNSEWAETNSQIKKRRQQINIMDERSEGEVGPVDIDDESIGEIITVSNPSRQKQTDQKNQRYNQKGENGKMIGKKDTRPLGQTVNYEGGKEGTASAYTYDEYDDSMSPNKRVLLNNNSDLDQLPTPIYDSKEDPIPKVKPKIGSKANGKNNILMSGESFGKNPLDRSSGGIQDKILKKSITNQKNNQRNKIEEDFLESNDDDFDNSDGEIYN